MFLPVKADSKDLIVTLHVFFKASPNCEDSCSISTQGDDQDKLSVSRTDGERKCTKSMSQSYDS